MRTGLPAVAFTGGLRRHSKTADATPVNLLTLDKKNIPRLINTGEECLQGVDPTRSLFADQANIAADTRHVVPAGNRRIPTRRAGCDVTEVWTTQPAINHAQFRRAA